MDSIPPPGPIKPSQHGRTSHIGSLSKRALDVTDAGVDEQVESPSEPSLHPESYPRKRYGLNSDDKIPGESSSISLSPEANLVKSPPSLLDSSHQPGASTLDYEAALLELARRVSAQRALLPLPQAPPPPFFAKIEACNGISFQGQPVKPVLSLDLEKGFFVSGDNVWTAYRASYFALRASFSIEGSGSGKDPEGDISVSESGQEKLVRRFTLRLRAENSEGQPVKVVQHTKSRGKDPAFLPTLFHVVPSTPLSLGHLELVSTGHWEHCQFIAATMGNGKSVAEQQYFHIIVELLAETSEHQAISEGICIARGRSNPLVVRGRTPSHDRNVGPHEIQCELPFSVPPLVSPPSPQTMRHIDHNSPPPPPPATTMSTCRAMGDIPQQNGNNSSSDQLNGQIALKPQIPLSPDVLTDIKQPLSPTNSITPPPPPPPPPYMDEIPPVSFGTTMHTFTRAMKERIQGALRPPLQPGMRQLFWRCECGRLMHDNFGRTEAEGLCALRHSSGPPGSCQHR